MEETPEGLAAAAATREAAKRKRAEEELKAPPAKKPIRPIPVLKHEVVAPDGFHESVRNLDQALHGAPRAVTSIVCIRAELHFFAIHAFMCASLSGTLDEPRWTGPMAKEYPFTLDPFQSTAVACLVRFVPPSSQTPKPHLQPVT